MTRTRFYAGFSAGLLSAIALTATLLISATPANTQASTQGIPIIEGDANSAIALQEMEAIVASAEQATANAEAAGEEISDWDLIGTFATAIPRYGLDALYTYTPVLADINGDGLPDQIYSLSFRHGNANTGGYTTMSQFVKLNTGKGWEQVFKCNMDTSKTPRYTGDCTYRNL